VGQSTSFGGKIFAFIICLKQIFLGTTQIGGTQKYLGGTAPECYPVATGLAGGVFQVQTIQFMGNVTQPWIGMRCDQSTSGKWRMKV